MVRKYTRFDPGKEQVRTLSIIVAYAMILNVFFFLLEVFTAFTARFPGTWRPLNTCSGAWKGTAGLSR